MEIIGDKKSDLVLVFLVFLIGEGVNSFRPAYRQIVPIGDIGRELIIPISLLQGLADTRLVNYLLF